MSLTPGIQVLFEQLGMKEELKKISLPFPIAKLYDENVNFMGEIVNPNNVKK